MTIAGATDRAGVVPGIPRLGPAVLAVVSIGLLAALVMRVGPVPALALILALAGSVAMLARPEAATLLTGFLLYINFPAILTKELGLPAFVAGGFILLLGFPLVHTLIIRKERFRTDAVFGLMLAFLGFLLLSTLAAVDTGLAMGRVWQFVAEGLLLYWLVINVIRDLVTLRRLFWVLLAAGGLVATLSLYQEVTGSYRQEFGGLAHRRIIETGENTPGLGVSSRERRAQGPVDEPNRFAQILIVLVPLSGFLYRTGQSAGARFSAGALGALALTGVVLTLSRGGLVTVALMAMLMVLFGWMRGRHLVAGTLLLITIFSMASPLFLDRISSIVNVRHLLGENRAALQQADGAIRGRTTEMLAALHVFLDHPLIGVGPGQFARFYSVQYAAKADIKFRDILIPRRAHSLYLELGAEHGMLGLGGFLAIVGLVMLRLWRARRFWLPRNAEAADLSTALWLSLFGYLSTGIFLHLSYQRYYWFLLAVASAGVHLLHARQRSAPARAEERTWPRSH